jgi:hypothetical protein
LLYNFPRRIRHSQAPGRNNPKCPDCKHDVRLQHHTPFGDTNDKHYHMGLCVACTRKTDKKTYHFCPSIERFFSVPRDRKTFEEEWKEFLDETT